MHAVAKVAWEVINGVRGRRRRNEEKEEEEESIDKASHKIETGEAPVHPNKAPQPPQSSQAQKRPKPRAKYMIPPQRKTRGKGCNNRNKNKATNSLAVKKAESKPWRRTADEKREKRKAEKVIILKENEKIGAPYCSHGIKDLADTTSNFAQVLADGGSDHSSDLAATEFWSCKKKGPSMVENREKKRLRSFKICERSDISDDQLVERDEKDFIKSLRHRRVLEQLERAESLEFKAKVERMIATRTIFARNYRTPEQIARDVELDRFECAIIHVYVDESSSRKTAASSGPPGALMNTIEDEFESDILDHLLVRSRSYTERRGALLDTTTTSVRHTRSTKTGSGMTKCPVGPENLHDVSHCSICMAGVQLKPSALLNQLKENHSMANWTPPFVRITPADRQENEFCMAERGFIDDYRQAYATGLLSSPPDEKFMRRTRVSRAEGEHKARQRRMGRAEQLSSSMPLSVEEGPNIGSGGNMLQARTQGRVGRERNNPCPNKQTPFHEEGQPPTLLRQPSHAGLPHHRTRRAVRAFQEEELVKEWTEEEGHLSQSTQAA